MRRKGNISKRCMVCIMSAMMMMSSVTGSMISPIGAYAAEYANTAQVPVVDGQRNLTSEDTLTLNDGTIHENNGIIHENNGTIVENAESATVDINNNEIQKNKGIVVKNSEGATVGAQNESIIGEVTNNYGTAENSLVESNYGTAKNSKVTDNYSSGVVTGDESTVSVNHGGNVEDGIKIEVDEKAVVSASHTEIAPVTTQDDTPDPEDNNDLPQPQVKTTNDGYVSELVKEIDKKLKNAIYKEILIRFGDKDNITVDEMRTLLLYTPDDVTIKYTSVLEDRIDILTIPPRKRYIVDEKGNRVLVDFTSIYLSCLDELAKEQGQLAGFERIAQIFAKVGISHEVTGQIEVTVNEPPLPQVVPDGGTASHMPIGAGSTGVLGARTPRKTNDGLETVDSSQPQTTAVTNANTAIAPVNVQTAPAKEDLGNAQLSVDGASIIMENGSAVSTTDLAFADTASVQSEHINSDAKANLYLTSLDSELSNGASLDQACNNAKDTVEKINKDLSEDIPNNLTDNQKSAFVEAYVGTIQQSMANSVSYDSARKQAILQAKNATSTAINGIDIDMTKVDLLDAANGIDVDVSKVDILDAATTEQFVQNSRYGYNVKISLAGGEGETNIVKIPADFDFRPFIKADGTMNMHEVIWSISSKKYKQ